MPPARLWLAHTCGCESNATTQVTRSAPTRPEPPSNSGNRAASPPSRGWKRFALRWAIGGTLIPREIGAPLLSLRDGKDHVIWVVELDEPAAGVKITWTPIEPTLPSIDFGDLGEDSGASGER